MTDRPRILFGAATIEEKVELMQRYIYRQDDRLKELELINGHQKELLDECEDMIATLRINESGETRRDADALLARLRGQENADE